MADPVRLPVASQLKDAMDRVDQQEAHPANATYINHNIKRDDGVRYQIWLDAQEAPSWTVDEQVAWVQATSTFVEAASKLLKLKNSAIGISIHKES